MEPLFESSPGDRAVELTGRDYLSYSGLEQEFRGELIPVPAP